ncbi:hypothetical protein JCM5353_004485 [Sporobolomyces roseus]
MQESNETRTLSQIDREQLVKLRSEVSDLEHCGPRSINLPGTSFFYLPPNEAKKINPVNEAISFQERYSEDLAIKDDSWRSWWSTYQLRYMTYRALQKVYIAAFELNPHPNSPSLDHGRYVDYAARALNQFCQNVVAKSDPEMSSMLVQSIKTSSEISKIRDIAI